ncbi:hypothetical protein MA9V1_091 [Chryseobacterium phage MA9V-1]|nr:hypothetical protein MA9V1_091 [Chryseobacterium phage MA9V-1]
MATNKKLHTETLTDLGKTYFAKTYFALFQELIVAKFPKAELIFTHFINERNGYEWINIYSDFGEYPGEGNFDKDYDDATINMIGESMSDVELKKDPNYRSKYNIYFGKVDSLYDDEVIIFHQNKK